MFNWSRSVKLGSKAQVVKLSSQEEVAATLAGGSGRVKVLGSGMSYGAIGAVENESDILLDLSQMTGCISFGGGEAQFHASTLLNDVINELVAQGMQLVCCPGVLMTQTIAGALATGTHGQGLTNGGISDAVIALTVVLADGSIHHYTKQNPEFKAFCLHLGIWRLTIGALGVITKATFQYEPLKIYRQVKEITHFDDLVANFEKWNELACHCKAWWFPETDDVQIWSTQYASPEEIKLYVENKKEMTEVDNRIANSDFSDSIGDLVEKMGNDTVSTNVKVKSGRFETVLRFREQKSLLGNQYQLWCKGIPGIILL